MNLISLALDARLSLHLTYLPLALTTEGVLKMSFIKMTLKKSAKMENHITLLLDLLLLFLYELVINLKFSALKI